jgi:hypothetical protein
MSIIGFILYLAVLLFICYQDFKQREISWWTLPLALCFYFMNEPLEISETISSSLFNIGFVLFNLIMISIYFSVKNSKLVNVINTYLGIGDLLFFLVCCFIFNVPNFLLFFISSLFISVIISLLFISKKEQSTIPLAGIMSFYLFTLSITDKFLPIKLFRNSDWLNNLAL